MCKKITIISLLFTFLSCTGVSFAQSSGSFTLYGTGKNNTGNECSSCLGGYFSFLGDRSFSGSRGITSFSGEDIFNSSGAISAYDGKLFIAISGSGTIGGIGPPNPAGGGNGSVIWSDSVTLVWNRSGSPPSLRDKRLIFKVKLHSSLKVKGSRTGASTASGSGSCSAQGEYTFSDSFSLVSPYSDQLVELADSRSVILSVTSGFPVTDGSTYKYNYGYSVKCSAVSRYGDALCTGGISLDSILFESIARSEEMSFNKDEAMPEEVSSEEELIPEKAGWKLIFESGISSPNLKKNGALQPVLFLLLSK